jgi:hypothetical protein
MSDGIQNPTGQAETSKKPGGKLAAPPGDRFVFLKSENIKLTNINRVYQRSQFIA